MDSNELKLMPVDRMEKNLNKLAKHFSEQVNREAIAGHNAAIDTLVKVIRDFMPMNGLDELVDTLINQYVEEIKVLRKELQEMKEKAMQEEMS